MHCGGCGIGCIAEGRGIGTGGEALILIKWRGVAFGLDGLLMAEMTPYMIYSSQRLL